MTWLPPDAAHPCGVRRKKMKIGLTQGGLKKKKKKKSKRSGRSVGGKCEIVGGEEIMCRGKNKNLSKGIKVKGSRKYCKGGKKAVWCRRRGV